MASDGSHVEPPGSSVARRELSGPRLSPRERSVVTWLSRCLTDIRTGYPDFYPSRPGFGQPEDELTEPFVKGGFAFKPAVNVTVILN